MIRDQAVNMPDTPELGNTPPSYPAGPGAVKMATEGL
jgi:hypothetical protein